MSRFKRFADSLVSGYVLLAANILYTLASYPLALHYLSKEEFGLWVLVTQVCNFNQIVIDLGMSGAIARILIDHKDDRESTAYGAVIQTGFLVLVVQGVLIAVIGGLLSYWLPQWVELPEKNWPVFRVLVTWQCVMLAVSFALRIFTFVLQSHQRYDICNYAQLACFGLGFIAQWLSFESGLGLYSLLVSGAITMLVVGIVCGLATRRLRLFPAPGRWGKPNWSAFKGLFAYGTDVFLATIGLQLITASQTPVIAADPRTRGGRSLECGHQVVHVLATTRVSPVGLFHGRLLGDDGPRSAGSIAKAVRGICRSQRIGQRRLGFHHGLVQSIISKSLDAGYFVGRRE